MGEFKSDSSVKRVAKNGVFTALRFGVFALSGIVFIHFLVRQYGFAAEGVGRMTGVPGVALATSGSGATNLVAAIGSCYFDSVPAGFITGLVNTTELSDHKGIRQQGFQETDIVSIVKPITKGALLRPFRMTGA